MAVQLCDVLINDRPVRITAEEYEALRNAATDVEREAVIAGIFGRVDNT